MKKTITFSRVAAILALAIAGQAASTLAASTNVLQHISLQLTYLTQGRYRTNYPATNDLSTSIVSTPVATKDVIHWIGLATSNKFPATASLLRVIHINGSTNFTTIEVRYGTNKVDVSEFFTDTRSEEKVYSAVYNEKTRVSTGFFDEILHLSLTNAPPYNLIPYFRVQGEATVTFVTASVVTPHGTTVLGADQVSALSLAGVGANTNGAPALVTGTLSILGVSTEVK